WVAFSRRPRPTVIATGAMALGLGTIVLAASTSFSLSLIAMVVAADSRVPVWTDRDGGRRRRQHRDGRDRQHDDPIERPGPAPWSRDERLHDRLRGLRPGRRAADGGNRLGVERAGVAHDRCAPEPRLRDRRLGLAAAHPSVAAPAPRW